MRAPRSKESAAAPGPLILPCPLHVTIPLLHHPTSPPFFILPHPISLSHPFAAHPISPPFYSLFPTSPSLLIFSSPYPLSYLSYSPHPPSHLPSLLSSSPKPHLTSILLLPYFLSFLHTSLSFTPRILIVSSRKKTGSGDYADLTSGTLGLSPALLCSALLCSLGTDALQASVSNSIQFV